VRPARLPRIVESRLQHRLQPLDLAQEVGDAVQLDLDSARWVYPRALGRREGTGSVLVWLPGTNPESKVQTIADAWV